MVLAERKRPVLAANAAKDGRNSRATIVKARQIVRMTKDRTVLSRVVDKGEVEASLNNRVLCVGSAGPRENAPFLA